MISAVGVLFAAVLLILVGCATSSGGNGTGGETGESGGSVEKEKDPEFCYDCFPYPVKKPDSSGEPEG
jgi:hypothetical protein